MLPGSALLGILDMPDMDGDVIMKRGTSYHHHVEAMATMGL
jgi:hypothetical protein